MEWKKMKISLTSVYVDDPIKAYKFYTETLGFVQRLYMPEMYLAIIASAEEPNGTGLLLEPNNNPIASTYQQALREGGFPVITFGTDDIQKEYERLKNLGVVFTKEPTPTHGGIEAIFDDTFGNYIQVFQVSA
jgi:predicted enzyme related to lactoylglutathione lyase